MNKQTIKQINNSLLIQLNRKIGEKEQISKEKAKQCTLIINDALTKLKEV